MKKYLIIVLVIIIVAAGIATYILLNKNTETAITQIKEKKYPESIEEYTGDILLVGINYDKKTKVHECVIEKYRKE